MSLKSAGDWFEERPLVLGTGSMYERLRRDPSVQYDEHLANAALIYSNRAAEVIAGTLLEYIEVARSRKLPMLLSTATWKASAPRIQKSVFSDRDVNGDQARFIRELRETRANDLDCLIAGAIGPIGDAYQPAEGLDRESALRLHAPQVEALARGGVDLIVAWTLPAASEARGLAAALANAEIPYILSFVVREDGLLLDGAALSDVISRIDDEQSRPPYGYFLNCVHPAVAGAALDACAQRRRVIGLKANSSSLRPEQLAGSKELVGDRPEALAASVAALRGRHPLRYVGGCCGTSTEHMNAIVGQLLA